MIIITKLPSPVAKTSKNARRKDARYGHGAIIKAQCQTARKIKLVHHGIDKRVKERMLSFNK